MGCDVHAFIEVGHHYTTDPAEPFVWLGFGDHIHLPRDYHMFGILAGVRVSDIQEFPLKGVPDDLGHEAFRYAWFRIVPADDWRNNEAGQHCVSDIEVGHWGLAGQVRTQRNNVDYVLNPDLHSHTWLTTDEYALCIGQYMLKLGGLYPVEYDATLAAMRAFEDRGYPCRLVLMFDN